MYEDLVRIFVMVHFGSNARGRDGACSAAQAVAAMREMVAEFVRHS